MDAPAKNIDKNVILSALSLAVSKVVDDWYVMVIMKVTCQGCWPCHDFRVLLCPGDRAWKIIDFKKLRNVLFGQ